MVRKAHEEMERSLIQSDSISKWCSSSKFSERGKQAFASRPSSLLGKGGQLLVGPGVSRWSSGPRPDGGVCEPHRGKEGGRNWYAGRRHWRVQNGKGSAGEEEVWRRKRKAKHF